MQGSNAPVVAGFPIEAKFNPFNLPHFMQRLHCPDCSFAAECDASEMLRWLQNAGMLRRAKDPDASLIEELFLQTADRFRCPACGRMGLIVEEVKDDWNDEAWGMARTCVRCRKPISRERLEIFPNATLCAACQNASEADEDETPEYCPRCGSIMTLRTTGAGGVQRYALVCPQCRR